jgi:hypothetical protein
MQTDVRKRLRYIARAHGFTTRTIMGVVHIGIDWINPDAGTTGIEWHPATTVTEALIVLGY